MVVVTLLFTSLAALCAAKPTERAFAVHESRAAVPSSFTSQGAAPASDTIDFRFGLVQKNISGLEERLFAVSTPSSPLYGQHLSLEQLNDYLSPSEETVDAVNKWLSDNGLTAKSASSSGDWIAVSATVDQANKLLNTKFETYTHKDSGNKIVRTLAYSLPADLHDHIEVVHPTTSFDVPIHGGPIYATPFKPSTNNGSVSDAVPSSCSSAITPACLQALYGIPTTAATQSSNQIAVPGFIGQYAQTADLTQFLKALRPDIPSSTTFTLQTIDGGSNPQGASQAGVEANLDVQYTVGVATKVPVVFISVGDQSQSDLGGFLDVTNFLIGESNRPHVMTTSYGQNEKDLSSSMAQRLCNAYMSLTSLGTSILFASGDGGVSGVQSGTCANNQFQPTFPSGCPYLTSVGGTTDVPETTVSFSGSGFSNFFGRPSYQSSAVTSYLNRLGSTNAGLFNTSGRAFPDVAAQGNKVEIVNGGGTYLVGGTSCSSPIFASVIGLINDRLVAAGKPVLGFLNPFLYANPQAFNDITTGHNTGCNTNGFPAMSGWDPVTGLGTPNFAALLKAAGL